MEVAKGYQGANHRYRRPGSSILDFDVTGSDWVKDARSYWARVFTKLPFKAALEPPGEYLF